jgi:hypothetical protein
MLRKLVLLALLATISPVSKPPIPSAGEVGSYQQNHAHDDSSKTTTRQNQTQPKPLLVEIVQSPQGNEEAAAEADHAKQETTDNWRMFVITCVLAVAAIFQWIVYCLQARLMWRTVRDNGLQFAMSERAFVYLSQLSVWPMRDQAKIVRQYRINPMWRNSGKSPTVNAQILVNWQSCVGDLPDNFGYPYTDPPMVAFLGPQAEVGSTIFDIPATEVAAVADGKRSIYIWGTIEYRDIFKSTKGHFTNFCLRLDARKDPVSGESWIGFTPYGGRNDTDDDNRQIANPKTVFDGWVASIVDIHKKKI